MSKSKGIINPEKYNSGTQFHGQPQEVHSKKINLKMNVFPVKISPQKIYVYDWEVIPIVENNDVVTSILEIALTKSNIPTYIIKKSKIFMQFKYKNISCEVTYNNIKSLAKIKFSHEINFENEISLQNDVFKQVCSKIGFDIVGRDLIYKDNSSMEKEKEFSKSYIQKNNQTKKRENLFDIPYDTPEINNKRKNEKSKNIRDFSNIFPTSSISNNKYELKKGIKAVMHSTNINSYFIEMDQTSKLIRKDSILKVINDLKQNGYSNVRIEQELIGQRLITPYNNQIYMIHGIDWKKNPRSTFLINPQRISNDLNSEDDNKIKISFELYFKKKYGKNTTDLNQPLIEVYNRKKKEIIYFLPEFCHLSGLSDFDSENYQIRKEITRETIIDPNHRYKNITFFSQNEDLKNNLDKWGIQIIPQMQNYQGELCTIPNIYINNQSIKIDQKQMNWAYPLSRTKVLESPNLNNWCILFEKRGINPNEVKKYAEDFCIFAEEKGMSCNNPKIIGVNDIPEFLKNLQFKDSEMKKYQLILTITPNKNKTRYRNIKQLCHEKLGIPNQNIVKKNILLRNRRRSAILRNLIMQVICKVIVLESPKNNKKTKYYSGALWKVNNLIIPDNSLIVGIDVWHGKSVQNNSIAGIICSTDKGIHYTSKNILIPRHGWEFISTLGKVIIKEIKEYYFEKKVRISNILIFRDGVGNSQFNRILQDELKSIQKEISKSTTYKNNVPNIAILLINKRINRRMFYENNKGIIQNPLPGSYAEERYIMEKYPNFYLVPHYSRFGTARPIHISIIFNNTILNNRKLVDVANSLCAQYYNWAGTIRVPAPIEYAHKIADHLGSNQITKIDPNLLGTYFFL